MSVKQSKPTPNLESSPGGLGDLVHQFTGTDLTALGQELIVPLGKLKNLRDGAPVHVKSVSVRVTVLMTTVALTMPATTPVLLVRSAIRAIRVEVDGHKFVDGQVDGADVYGDFSKRAQAAYESAEPATIPDADAAGVSRTFIIPLYFVSPAPAAGCENDGAVPLAFFDPQQADPSVLAFSLATTLRGFLGVTITSFTLIDVYADLVPLPELRFPTTHRLYVVTATGELDITTRPTGKIEYAVVADISDANGAFAETATEADYTLEGLWIGDQQMLASRSSAQLIDIFNQKLSPASVSGEGGLRKLQSYIETAMNLGLDMIQFNVVDVKTLRDAQAHPEKYADLVVRISGFNAHFVDLNKFVQDSVIERTEHALA